MSEKVLIIDDDQSFWEEFANILKKYDIGYFPTNKIEFTRLQNLLQQFAKDESVDVLLIENELGLLENVNYKYVFLDLCFDENSEVNKSGFSFFNKVKEKVKNNKLYILSEIPYSSISFPKEFAKATTIQKSKAAKVLENRIVTQFIEKEFPSKKNKDVEEYGKKRSLLDKIVKLIEDNSANCKRIIDVSIVSLLYLSIICITIVSIVFATIEVFEHAPVSLVKIVENMFLIFMPTIVLFGFSIFYQRTIKQHLVSDKQVEVDYENASKLINITKKLFLTSLISYLFISLTEILLKKDKKDQYEFYDNKSNLLPWQIGLVIAIIIVLIFYYKMIAKHSDKSD